MSRKKIIVVAILLIVIAGGWYGYNEYNRKVKDLSKVSAHYELKAHELISDFEKDEAAANSKYLDKIIGVKGTVKAVEKDEKGFYSVIIGEEGSMSAVRCSIDPDHNKDAATLVTGKNVVLKGACTGFNADELLGSDVILNRCVVEEGQP